MQKLCSLHKRLLNSFSTSWVKNRCLKISVFKWYRFKTFIFVHNSVKVGPKPVFIPLSNICIQSYNFPGLLVEYIINMRLVSWHGSVSLVSCQADTVTDFTSSSRIQTLCCHNLSELAATRNIKN